MPQDPITGEQPRLRLAMVLFGVLAGLAAWMFSDVLPTWIEEGRSYLFFSALTFGFFAMLLALTGPARPLPSVPLAAAGALVAAGLLWLGSWRHDSVETYLQLGYPMAAFGLMLLVATPFAAAALWSWRGWRDYPTLFELSWRILVRYASAVIFTLLFWGLVLLSDALLRLVGVNLMTWIQSVEALSWLLTGAVFGMALAVVHEMRDYLSPYLVLRLLRLFVPVVLAVVAAFLLLLPVRGLSGLVGALSAAGTLLSAALAAIVLITVAVDRDAREEVGPGWLRTSVQALALLVPLLGALAIYAIWVRVGQYGWTPERLMAASVALVLTLYGLAYSGAVLGGDGWMVRLRAANVAMALLVLALCALWLSPVFVPERIAAQSQLARFEAGRTAAGDLPLQELSGGWGKAGLAVLAELEADPGLAQRIAAARALRAAPSRALDAAALRAALGGLLVVQGGVLTDGMLDGVGETELAGWYDACQRAVTGGPGCVLVLGRFAPGEAVTRGLLFLNRGDRVDSQALVLREGVLLNEGYVVDASPGSAFGLPVAVLEALHRGEGRVAPAGMQTLQIEGHAFFPEN